MRVGITGLRRIGAGMAARSCPKSLPNRHSPLCGSVLACGGQPSLIVYSHNLCYTRFDLNYSVNHGETRYALLKDDRLLREKEVSEMLGVAIATL